MANKSAAISKGNGYTMTISTKRKIAVVALTTVALSLGAINAASAAGAKPKSATAKAEHKAEREANHQEHEANHQAREALVVSIIGIDAATIKSRLKAGETLGAIAGAKKSALIAALVAEATKNIDAAVAAGKITAADAATHKAGLTEHITAKVDAVRGQGHGEGGPGDRKDHGKKHAKGIKG